MRLIPALLCCLPLPALAQDPAAFLTQAWQTFEATCEKALFDQSTFIAETPNPGPNGITTVATTPDRQIIEARQFMPGYSVVLKVIGLPGLRINTCVLHNNQETADAYGSTDDTDVAPWIKAMENAVRPLAPAPMVGGALNLGYAVTMTNGQIVAAGDQGGHSYSVVFDWQGERVPALLEIAPYSVEFTAIRMEAG